MGITERNPKGIASQLMQSATVIAWSLTFCAALPAAGETGLLLGDNCVTPSDFFQLITKQHNEKKFLSPTYGLARLEVAPTATDRATLFQSGISLLSPCGQRRYFIRIDWPPAERAQWLAASGRLGMQFCAIPAAQKVAPPLWAGLYGKYNYTDVTGKARNYVVNPDKTINIVVYFFPTIDSKVASKVLYGTKPLRLRSRTDVAWEVTVRSESLQALASENTVRWIDAASPPLLMNADMTRSTMAVDSVQQFDFILERTNGLSGKEITVGVVDTGIDCSHPDLSSNNRCQKIAPFTNRCTHGTHMAGLIGGNGAQSGIHGGTARQWRGMAPESVLLDFPGANRYMPQTYADAISEKFMNVSNHSYAVNSDGIYNGDNETLDCLIRGGNCLGYSVSGRPQIHSSGNRGELAAMGDGGLVGYFSLEKQLKNAVVVGNFNAYDNTVSGQSSLGPTHDGRIKPDLVAPGEGVTSTGYCSNIPDATCWPVAVCGPIGAPDTRTGHYISWSGSSQASAATAGVTTLLMQAYSDSYELDIDTDPPLPSTVRAVLVNSASDRVSDSAWFENIDGEVQAFEGPDFATGFGMVNAQGAVDTINEKKLLEDVISHTGDSRRFQFSVPVGSADPVTLTLAWDDMPGCPNLATQSISSTQLINDLDVTLYDPEGNPHYPWQLGQEIVNLAGTTLTNSEQVPGTLISVRRTMAPCEAADCTQDILDNGVPAATKGRDHLNNVEQVEVENPPPGKWIVEVSGFDLNWGPQSFSLVGQQLEPERMYWMPIAFCQRHTAICRFTKLDVVCANNPALCEPRELWSTKDGFVLRFANDEIPIVVPIRHLCGWLSQAPNIGSSTRCGQRDLVLKGIPPGYTVELLSSAKLSLVKSVATQAGTIVLPIAGMAVNGLYAAFRATKGAKDEVRIQIALKL